MCKKRIGARRLESFRSDLQILHFLFSSFWFDPRKIRYELKWTGIFLVTLKIERIKSNKTTGSDWTGYKIYVYS